jgi:hypothetical protein
MKTFNTLARWIVVSSTNPSDVSLTIKGILVGIVPTALILAGFAHVDVGSDQLNAIIDGIVSVVQTLLTLISVVMTTYGLLRKFLNTVKVHQQVTTPPQQ